MAPAEHLDTDFLPDLLRRIAGKFGLGVALQFADDFGGREIKLPAKASPDHAIAKAVGLPVLAWLLKHRHPGEKLVVPLGPLSTYSRRIATIRRMLREDAPTERIVREIRCHERTIRRHRAAARAAQPLPLFEGRKKAD